jgi:DNA-binding transcriptional LysR family regulator
MNIEQLHYIIEVAKTKSLLSAANNLHVSQSAISQSISNLEAELGIKLFNRSRIGTIPTAEGRIVIKKASGVVRTLQDIKDEAKHYSEISIDKMCIGAIPGIMNPLIRTISNLKKDYPGVHFSMTEKGPEEILTQIRQNEVDFGLISIDSNLDNNEMAGLHFEPLWKGKIVVGVWKNSPLASKKFVKPDELIKYPFALFDIGSIHKFIDNLNETMGPVNILFSSNNPIAIACALKEGLAITIGYDFSFIDNPLVLSGDLVMIEIADLEQKPVILGWVRSENNKTSLISKQFINRFQQEIGLGYL